MKLANISLAKKISDSKVNFLSHMKYYLAVVIALLVSAIFIVSFLGINADFDYKGGTVLTVVSNGVKEEDKYNEMCNKIENILNENNVSISSFQYEESAYGDAIVVKILNKDNAVNNTIKTKLNTELGYNVEDLVEKNYVQTSVVDATAINSTKMATLALFVALAILTIVSIFRYNFSIAINYLVSTLLNLIIVFASIIICRIPVNVSITVSFAVVLLISTIFNLLFFKQVKQNSLDENLKDKTRVEIANITLREIFSPLTIIAVVLIITFVLLAGFGTMQIRAFAIPCLIGVIFSALSTYYFTPSFWNKVNIKRKIKSKKN